VVELIEKVLATTAKEWNLSAPNVQRYRLGDPNVGTQFN
jgi:hypothetical protein